MASHFERGSVEAVSQVQTAPSASLKGQGVPRRLRLRNRGRQEMLET